MKRCPQTGALFPYLCTVRAGDRATEFKQRCDGLEIKGVSLHSYRYAWAERALKCGYPDRFAQQALGHNSKAVHHAYSKNAEVMVPSLDEWEKQWKKREIQRPKFLLAALTFPDRLMRPCLVLSRPDDQQPFPQRVLVLRAGDARP